MMSYLTTLLNSLTFGCLMVLIYFNNRHNVEACEIQMLTNFILKCFISTESELHNIATKSNFSYSYNAKLASC